MVPEISARELAERMRGEHPPILIDVREPGEFEYCRIAGAQLRPLGGILTWVKELNPEAEIVFQCHTGVRSMQAAMYAQRPGYKQVVNLKGGIDAWSVQVDPTVPRY